MKQTARPLPTQIRRAINRRAHADALTHERRVRDRLTAQARAALKAGQPPRAVLAQLGCPDDGPQPFDDAQPFDSIEPSEDAMAFASGLVSPEQAEAWRVFVGGLKTWTPNDDAHAR